MSKMEFSDEFDFENRITDTSEIPEDTAESDNPLRPKTLSEYIGQEKAQKDADMLFEKTAKESKKELEKASEKANLECDILSRTADKNRKRVIDGAIQRLSL